MFFGDKSATLKFGLVSRRFPRGKSFQLRPPSLFVFFEPRLGCFVRATWLPGGFSTQLRRTALNSTCRGCLIAQDSRKRMDSKIYFCLIYIYIYVIFVVARNVLQKIP